MKLLYFPCFLILIGSALTGKKEPILKGEFTGFVHSKLSAARPKECGYPVRGDRNGGRGNNISGVHRDVIQPPRRWVARAFVTGD
jgi:hypothetical protein